MSDAVALHLPGFSRFSELLEEILHGGPPAWLQPAIPYSVIAENCSPEPLALVGIRFDLTGTRGRKMSVIHIADTLRNPEKTEFHPGASRFFCAEAEYAAAVLHGKDGVGMRASMNLQNLKTMVSVTASVDCFAFADGRFCGPDTGKAFERFLKQRASELEVLSSIMNGQATAEHLASDLNSQDSARRALARKLLDAFVSGGREAMLDYARRYRPRILLLRNPLQ